MNYYIYRNGQSYGPYSVNDLASMTKAGKVLKCDQVSTMMIPSGQADTYEKSLMTVGTALKANGIKVKVDTASSIIGQLEHIGRDLLLPKELSEKATWTKDRRLIALAAVGLIPLLTSYFVPTDYLSFYVVSLYFSCVWWVFFHYMFATPQVSVKTSVTIFFLTQLAVFVIWDLLGLANLNFFYAFTKTSSPFTRLVGYVLGVGLTEEFGKAISLIYILYKARKPLVPQTMVFYGLVSGVAFGVFEGVMYQLNVNSGLDYGNAYLMNIARLTSLPFLHALWSGIAGFFLSFAFLYPRYRQGLFVLAILIPAILHGVYDTFCSNFIGFVCIALPTCVFSIGLLTHYLKNALNYQSRLK